MIRRLAVVVCLALAATWRRRGSLTIRLRQPEVVTRGLTQLFLNGAEAAQFYDAMATKLHQPKSRPAAPSTP